MDTEWICGRAADWKFFADLHTTGAGLPDRSIQAVNLVAENQNGGSTGATN